MPGSEPVEQYTTPRQRLESVYDSVADQYAILYAQTPSRLIELGTRFLSSLPVGARVLDVGCGPGYQMAWMEAQGFRVTGIDLSTAM